MVKISTEYIKLDQFLKMTGLVDTGGQAKSMILDSDIRVNGEGEKRRGRKLYPGDEVIVNGKKFRIE